jgi:hypothetical protein
MAAGYVAGLLWLSACILWWSGWREELADRVPPRAVALFLAGWPLLAMWSPRFGSVSVNGAFVWTGAAALVLSARLGGRIWTVWSAGAMLGAIAMFVRELPVLFPDARGVRFAWESPAAMGAAAALTSRRAADQFVALTIGAAVPEAAAILAATGARVGSAVWMDDWWTAGAASRALTVTIAYIGAWMKHAVWRREGEQP